MLRLLRLFLLAAAVSLLTAGSALAAGLQFSAPVQLPNGNPDAHPYYSGGEPSIAFDPNGDGHVYVTAPQFIPTGVDNAAAQGPDSNVRVSVLSSSDSGQSFPLNVLTGASNGGGDSDVEVLQDPSVLVADLEAAATDICISKDFGKT